MQTSQSVVLQCTNYLYITINPGGAIYQTQLSTPPSVRLLSLYTLSLTDHSSQVISLTHQISTFGTWAQAPSAKVHANNKKLHLTALFTQQTSVYGFVCSTKQKGLAPNLGTLST